MSDDKLITMMVDAAVQHGHLTAAERTSFNVLRHRPRHAALLNNFNAQTFAAGAGGYVGFYSRFKDAVIEPLRPWLEKDAAEREDRERHERVMAAQRANAEARAAGLPTRAEVEAAAEAEAAAKVEAAEDNAFLSHFPALPEPVAGNFLRKAREAQDKATEEALAKLNTPERHERPGSYRSARDNAVARS